MSKDLHTNHRSRIRARFIKDGNLDSFEEHQILELLLFYAVPRRDTNDLAHKLLNEYGSLHTLMNARPEDIQKRCKVSETTAVLISMMPHLSRKFLNSGLKDQDLVLNSFGAASKYFKSLLAGQPFESFYMICLDMNKKVKKVVKISDGNSNSSPVYMEKVVGDALLHNSAFVLIGHNHPSGNKKPSAADIKVTTQVVSALSHINIKVLDHIIICGDGHFSFAQNKLSNLAYV